MKQVKQRTLLIYILLLLFLAGLVLYLSLIHIFENQEGLLPA